MLLEEIVTVRPVLFSLQIDMSEDRTYSSNDREITAEQMAIGWNLLHKNHATPRKTSVEIGDGAAFIRLRWPMVGPGWCLHVDVVASDRETARLVAHYLRTEWKVVGGVKW